MNQAYLESVELVRQLGFITQVDDSSFDEGVVTMLTSAEDLCVVVTKVGRISVEIVAVDQYKNLLCVRSSSATRATEKLREFWNSQR